jgi:hypothetical protein
MNVERKLIQEIHAEKKLEEEQREKAVRKKIDEYEFKTLKDNWDERDKPVEDNADKNNIKDLELNSNTAEQKKELTPEQIAMQNEASQYHQKAEAGELGKSGEPEKNQSNSQQESIGVSDEEEKKVATSSPEKNKVDTQEDSHQANQASTEKGELSQAQIEMRQAASQFHAEVEAGTLGKSKEADLEKGKEMGREREQEHENERPMPRKHEEELVR